MSKKILLISALAAYVLMGSNGSSFAGSLKDDVIVIPPPSWEGRFIGISGGYVKGGDLHQSGKTEVLLPPDSAHGSALAESIGGGTFGAHLGYNHIVVARGARGLMVGAIIDMMSLSTKNKISQVVDAGVTGHTEFQQQSITSSAASVSALATARLRAGIATDHMLFYISGGMAAAKIAAKTDSKTAGWSRLDIDGTSSVIAQGHGSKNHFGFGYVVGAGVEFRLSDQWSLGLDYSYYQIPVSYRGTIEVSDGYSGANGNYDVKGTIGDHLVKAQMSYALNY